ncbi:hypothetical protein VE01_03205 [Pseudogymnoascus verrucosus]|uniref:Uncharacterized protein n=1 Tax=Pseudogymnoascus verrucosus TaxID=342668 RepID=A0A1B8GRA6_9PEZI|nr:uncharacterized protein VE01_03205 [Pseudogymnoascus verrucosus]OBT98372.1 hypothetical protein VE01_03205 [Pseudogymnoascus verrucosus]
MSIDMEKTDVPAPTSPFAPPASTLKERIKARIISWGHDLDAHLRDFFHVSGGPYYYQVAKQEKVKRNGKKKKLRKKNPGSKYIFINGVPYPKPSAYYPAPRLPSISPISTISITSVTSVQTQLTITQACTTSSASKKRLRLSFEVNATYSLSIRTVPTGL